MITISAICSHLRICFLRAHDGTTRHVMEVCCDMSCVFRAEVPCPTAAQQQEGAEYESSRLAICKPKASFLGLSFSIFMFFFISHFLFSQSRQVPHPRMNLDSRGFHTAFLSTKLVLGPTSTDALPLLLVCCTVAFG